MALYVISDLHLSTDPAVNKPMDVFGYRWKDYTQRIQENWKKIVTDEDTVVIPGDISWGMHLDEAKADFAMIDALPGKKIIGKGNHDLWWQSMKKMTEFKEQNGFSTLHFLFNNYFESEKYYICGSRGWWWDDSDAMPQGVDPEKVIAREVGRLRASLSAARLADASAPHSKEPLAFLHFPATFAGKACQPFLDVLKEFGVRRCYFGHIHGVYDVPPSFTQDDITFTMVSADYLRFSPLLIDRDDHFLP